jgi:hypothetical protein
MWFQLCPHENVIIVVDITSRESEGGEERRGRLKRGREGEETQTKWAASTTE